MNIRTLIYDRAGGAVKGKGNEGVEMVSGCLSGFEVLLRDGTRLYKYKSQKISDTLICDPRSRLTKLSY